MNFGDNLKKLRKVKKISQEELADKIGVSRQSVSKWECGDAYPEMSNILILCTIFNCKINDLIHENFIDFDSLDEEIKMSVVKFKKEKQKKMKLLSKAIYILARIGKIISIVGIASVIIAMFIIPFIVNNIEFQENNLIRVFDKNVDYHIEDENIVLRYENKKYEITDSDEILAFNIIIEKFENNSMVFTVIFMETAFAFLIATLMLLYFIMKHLEKLFVNIYSGDTPFTMENVDHIKKLAIFMIAMVILPNVSALIIEFIIDQSLDIGFETFDIVYILFLFSMAFIFEYGYQIQLDSKGKIYGDINE